MKTVAIVGAGAIGTFLGTYLARSGADVSVLARGATAAALRAHGFRFEEGGTMLTASVRVAEDTAALGPQELVALAVKGPSLPGLADAVRPLLGPDTVVLTAMNGVPWWFFHGLRGPHEGAAVQSVDPDGRLAAAIPTRHVIGGVVHATCSVREPGLVRHGFGRGLIIGEPSGAITDRVRALADRLTAAGFETTVSQRIQADVWYKLWGNMTMNPMSALTGATCDRLLDDPLVERFTLAIMAEAAAIGDRIGCPIQQSGEDRNAVTRKLGAFKTSMLQDVEAGRPLEIDALLTAVSEIGRRVRVPTPSTDALLGLTRVFAAGRGLY
ncbi:MAG TPA: 2-dehydropantoate 2-reductase [Candidatus Deferrimicrobiaceae bacterium]|nr:2-dehydropantoate 2-reductase [Candidatus Deferrimicrobiaceae bacterium]